MFQAWYEVADVLISFNFYYNLSGEKAWSSILNVETEYQRDICSQSL